MVLESKTVHDKLGRELMRVVLYDDKGRQKETRTLSMENYFGLLGRNLKETKRFVEIRNDRLPKGYITGWYADDDNYTVIFKVAGKTRQFVYRDGGHYRIPYPDLVFVVGVRKGQIIEKYTYVIDDKDNLFQYPFGNVSTQGAICTGNIDIKGLTLDEFAEEFFLGVTNDDYWQQGNHISPKSFSQKQMLEKLDGKDKFPMKWLLKASPYTLDKLISSHSKK